MTAREYAAEVEKHLCASGLNFKIRRYRKGERVRISVSTVVGDQRRGIGKMYLGPQPHWPSPAEEAGRIVAEFRAKALGGAS